MKIKNHLLLNTILMVVLISSNVFAQVGYENQTNLTLQNDKFSSAVLTYINLERQKKGLKPLLVGSIATLTARTHSDFLLTQGYLSYYDHNYLLPEERYLTLNGIGAITEIIKGFESNSSSIQANSTLAKQLVEALIVGQDDSRIIFNPQASHIGIGVSTSQDGKKFVAVIEVIIGGGQFISSPTTASLGQSIKISGRVFKPATFKALSIAYVEDDTQRVKSQRDHSRTISTDDLKPYFPPQDYIAHIDAASRNLKRLLTGVLIVGSIGAAPFTYGASQLFAPILIESLYDGQTKKIPVKGGVDSSANGSFTANIPLNYLGKAGLYYVSILADLPGSSTPVVVARKIVKVGV